ncbi:hypothetical protein P607_20455 [Comamonas thiooxydans]|nr:hypothetical protein P607_20455 [Comamonas thiooxydans]
MLFSSFSVSSCLLGQMSWRNIKLMVDALTLHFSASCA